MRTIDHILIVFFVIPKNVLAQERFNQLQYFQNLHNAVGAYGTKDMFTTIFKLFLL